MVSKRLISFVFLLLLVVPLVFASIDINIKTLPKHRVSVIIRDVGKLTSLDSHHKDTGTGEFTINSDVDKSKIDLIVTLKKDGKNLLNEKFEEVSTSEVININLIPGEVKLTTGILEPEVNESEEETEEVVEENVSEEGSEVVEEEVVEENVENTEIVEEEQKKESGKILGAIIGSGKSMATSKITYYIIGGILVVGVLFFVVAVARKKIGSKDEKFKVVKLGEAQESNLDYDSKLENAEKKIKEAKEELDELKGKRDKLKDLRERYERDKEELKNLGEED